MSAPYSYDLRSKAIEAIKRGKRKTDVCRFFKISRNTLDLWLKREQETGDCQAIAQSIKGRKPKIEDEDKFRKFVNENSDKTQKQIAELWGESLTQQNISYACKKMGITRKKNLRLSTKK